MHKEDNKTIDFKQLTMHILDSYLNSLSSNDMDVVNLLDENMSVIGTGKHEFYKNLEEFYSSFQFEQAQREKIHFEWKDFNIIEHDIDENNVMVYGSVVIIGMFENGTACINMDTRFTILYGCIDGTWKVLHIHHSIPDKEQLSNEEFPRTLGKKIEESTRIIMALSSDYNDVYVVDIEKDSGRVIKQDGVILNEKDETLGKFCYSKAFSDYARQKICNEDIDVFLKTVMPDEIAKKFNGGKEKLEINFRIIDEGKFIHYSALFIKNSKPNEPLKIIIGIRNTENIISAQKKNRVEGLYSAYAALSDAYNLMNRVNVKKNTFSMIKSTNDISDYASKPVDEFEKNAITFMKRYVETSDYASILNFINLKTLDKRMNGKKHISIRFNSRNIGTCRLHFIKESSDEDGKLEYVIFAVEILTEDDFYSGFDVLSKNYQNVYLINLNDETLKALKDEDGFDIDNDNKENFLPYSPLFEKWIENKVYPLDRQSLLDATNFEHICKILKTSDEYSGNYRRLIDNTIHNYQFCYKRINNSKYAIVTFQNIDAIIEAHFTKEKLQKEKDEAYQKELIKAKEEADRANKAKTNFLLRMSHDIRTPINGIVGMLDIGDRYANDLHKQVECRDKIRNASKVLLELVNEVLDMSKLESGELILEHEPFDFIEVTKEAVKCLSRQAEERNVTIVEEYGIKHSKLIGSSAHVKRLVMNVISNAVKYNKDNGQIHIAYKEISNDEDSVKIQFRCSDTGVGISEKFLPHIFEPFSQENTSARTKFEGTGLGMSIAKNIVDKMGGTINVLSTKNEGTTFDIVLPFMIDKNISDKEDETNDESFSIKDMKILLVEDNDLNMEITKFLLEDDGAKVVEARNGKEAVELFNNSALFEFDVILMDVLMPIMDGHEATEAIRELNRKDSKDIPIIAMSANAFVEDKLKAKQAGMNEHLSKPLDHKLLIKTIAKYVNEYRNR